MKRDAFLSAIRRMGFRVSTRRMDSQKHVVRVYRAHGKRLHKVFLTIRFREDGKDRRRTFFIHEIVVHHDSKVNLYPGPPHTFFYDKITSIREEK